MKKLKINKTIIGVFIVGVLSGFLLNVVLSEISHQQLLKEIEATEEEIPLKLLKPISCTSSSQLNEYQGCENLYDYTPEGWEDNNQNCKDQWIEFEFSKPVKVEFVVMQNYDYPPLRAQKDSIRNFELIFKNINGEKVVFNESLQDTTESQWFDTYQQVGSKIVRFNVLSSYDTLGVETCHLEALDFYGYDE